MGKKSSSEEKLGVWLVLIIIVLVIIWFAFAFAVLISPLVIVILFLVYMIGYLARDRKQRVTNFWLSHYDREQYKKTAYILAQAEEERKKVQDSVNIKGIPRNQDGQISQRSYAGRGLRERENTANSLIDEYTPVYNELRHRPYIRWQKARSRYSKAFGFGFILVLCVVMIGLAWLRTYTGSTSDNRALVSSEVSEIIDSTKIFEQHVQTEESVQTKDSEQTENSTGDSISYKDIMSGYGTSLGVMAGFLGVLVVIWFIGWLIGRIRFGLKNPEPPLVSIYNVDTYADEFMMAMARKSDEREQRKEERKQKRDQKAMAKKQAQEDKIRISEKEAEEAKTQKVMKEEDLHKPASEPEISAPVLSENNTRQRSNEEGLFISWADRLRSDGYDISGNWDNWENAGDWKNLGVVSRIENAPVRLTIEYYAKRNQVYYGIAKVDGEDKVSQELLNSETFRNIITENGLTVKNNEWWYCQRFSSLNRVFEEFNALLASVERL